MFDSQHTDRFCLHWAAAFIVGLPYWAICGVGTYSVTMLPSAGGRSSTGARIAENGDVMLVPTPPTDSWQAFVYDGSGENTILTPVGVQFGGQSINSSGQVAGNLFPMVGLDPNAEYQGAAVWTNGTLTVLPHPTLLPTGQTTVVGINDSGEVVGNSWQSDGKGGDNYHAILWKNGNPIVLDGIFATQSLAFGINNKGSVIGGLSMLGYSGAVLWQDGAMTRITGVPGINGTPLLNNADQVLIPTVIRDSDGLPMSHWYLWDAGQATELPALTFFADGLFDVTGFNTQGTIIANYDDHAMIYQDGVLSDLNSLLPADSGWDLTAAYGLNDAGQIVGTGLYNGQQAAFLLTPAGTSLIPEPTSCALAGTAFVGLLLRRRRRASDQPDFVDGVSKGDAIREIHIYNNIYISFLNLERHLCHPKLLDPNGY